MTHNTSDQKHFSWRFGCVVVVAAPLELLAWGEDYRRVVGSTPPNIIFSFKLQSSDSGDIIWGYLSVLPKTLQQALMCNEFKTNACRCTVQTFWSSVQTLKQKHSQDGSTLFFAHCCFVSYMSSNKLISVHFYIHSMPSGHITCLLTLKTMLG